MPEDTQMRHTVDDRKDESETKEKGVGYTYRFESH